MTKALPHFVMLAEDFDLVEHVNERVVVYLDKIAPNQNLQAFVEGLACKEFEGERGARGQRGRRGVGDTGEKGDKGDTGDAGGRGEPGPKGDRGATGSAPAHEWSNAKLRFRNPDGSWGAFVRLKGDTGLRGGGGGSRASANQGFSEVVLNGTSLEFRRFSAGPLGESVIVELDALASSLAYFLGE